MVLNESADWSSREINVRPDVIKHFWTPDTDTDADADHPVALVKGKSALFLNRL